MRVLRLHPATLAATCLLVLAGCGGVDFDHPLSDESSSVVDEQLIGIWEVVPASVDEEEPGTGVLWPRLAVGKSTAVPTFMEAVSMEIEDGVVKVERMELRATRIGDHRYLTVFDPDKLNFLEPVEEEGGKFLVVRYSRGEGGHLAIEILDEEVFAKAVRAGELQGKISGDAEDDLEPLAVHVTTDGAGVRAWLEAHADTCCKAEGFALRRLREKGSGEEADEPAGPSEGPEQEDRPEDDE